MKFSHNNMKITIVIPTYNRAHLIKDAIKSVLVQTHKDWELIIVDDGSTDEPKDIVDAFTKDDRVLFVKRPSNLLKGANSCRNYGFELAKGDYIKWLDSDDKLHEKTLEVQLKNLTKTKADVDICQSEFFNPDGNNIRYNIKEWGSLFKSQDLARDMIFGNIRWQTAAGLWPKKDLPKKPFNEKIQNSQEWLFHIEMTALQTLKYSFTKESLVFVRDQSGSMSHSSNQKGNYFYNSALARYIAISKLFRAGYNNNARKYLFKKFVRLHLYTLYKGSLKGFLKNSVRVPSLLFKTFV
jgi:glycosyltransferase involved in cell wall biosynthesis